MLLDVGAKLDLLDADGLLLLLGFLLALLLLIAVLAEIHDAADRGLSLGSNLHQVQMLFLSHAESLAGGHDAQLLAGSAGDADLTDVNLLIDA